MLDKIFLNRKTGIPVMLILFGLIMWITVAGANYPSELLNKGLFAFGDLMSDLLIKAGTPPWIESLLVQGIYKVLAWVISVMLPKYFIKHSVTLIWFIVFAFYCFSSNFSGFSSCFGNKFISFFCIFIRSCF